MKLFPLVLICAVVTMLFSCRGCSDKPKPVENDIVQKPEEFTSHLTDNIQKLCSSFDEKKGKINDSTKLKYYEWINDLYTKNNFTAVWSEKKEWKPEALQLIQFIDSSRYYGLFPQDYYQKTLKTFQKKFHDDATEQKNAAAWARADIILTDAAFLLCRHLKLGHFPTDSISVPKVDSIYGKEFFTSQVLAAATSKNIYAVLDSLEPKHEQFKLIKSHIRSFLDSNKFEQTTYIFFPNKDTAKYYQQLQKRLVELGLLKNAETSFDTATIRAAVAKFQKSRGIKADSVAGESTVDALNSNGWEKFKRIVINMDRYRQLPETMPEKYIFVNLPSFMLTVKDADTMVMQSRVVVGNPKTRTPELNSKVYEFITMPYWTVPNSIIMKEMLHRLIVNPGYLAKNGYVLLDSKGESVDPASVTWKKFVGKKGIPYRIRQNPGDDNSLGVIKFNFSNNYAVYMHDTNARGYFKRNQRALSHGCVRVQDWEKLAAFLSSGDSIRVRKDSLSFERVPLILDTIKAWVAREERHTYSIKQKVPVFFRYITCEVKDDKLVFLDDIYKEDKMLREKYFANKSFQ